MRAGRPPDRPLPGGCRPDLAARPVAAARDELDGRGRHDVHRRLGALRRADRHRAVDVGLGPGPARGPPPRGGRRRPRARARRRAARADGRDVPQPAAAERLPGLGAAPRHRGAACRGPGARPRVPRDRADRRRRGPARPPRRRRDRCASTPSSSPPGTSTPPRPTPSSTSPPGPPRPGCATCPPEQTTDTDLSGIEPGEPVIVRGHRAGVRRPGRAAVRGPRRPLRAGPRAGRVRAALRARPAGSRCCTSGRRGARSTTPRPSTRCAAAARSCPGSSARRPSTRWSRAAAVDLRDRGVAADGQGDRLGLVPRAAVRPPRPRPARRRHLHRPVRGRRLGLAGDGRAARRGGARPAGPHRLRRAGPPAGRRARRLAGRAAAAGARAHRGGPAPARRPRAHPAPRRVRRDAVGVRAGHPAGHRRAR